MSEQMVILDCSPTGEVKVLFAYLLMLLDAVLHVMFTLADQITEDAEPESNEGWKHLYLLSTRPKTWWYSKRH